MRNNKIKSIIILHMQATMKKCIPTTNNTATDYRGQFKNKIQEIHD